MLVMPSLSSPKSTMGSARTAPTTGSPAKTPSNPATNRKALVLANRIALLKQEEMRTWKKIEETKKRAADVMRLKQRNNERVAQKIEYQQEKEFEKKMLVEQNMRMRLMNQQEKEKIMQAIKDSKAEEASQAKMKAN